MAAGTASITSRKLPAGLGHARNQSLRGQFAKSKPGNLEPANERPPAAGNLAAIHDAGRACIAWKLRQASVILLRFELRPQRGIFLHRRTFAVISIDPGCL